MPSTLRISSSSQMVATLRAAVVMLLTADLGRHMSNALTSLSSILEQFKRSSVYFLKHSKMPFN